MKTASGEVVRIDFEKLENHIKEIEGSRFAGTRIAEFIMGYDKTYWTAMKKDKKCNIKGLDKLCAYYNLNKNDYIVIEEVKAESTPEKKEVLNIDTLIVGLNQIYEIEKQNSELMTEILEQLKIVNTKTNRLENALGQTVSNVIEIKNTTNNSNGLLKDLKSTGAVVSGRLRDMVAKFK